MMKKSKGFTLIELIVVVAIIGIMLSGVLAIFDQGVKMYAKDNTQVANQQSLRTVMTSIEKKIRKADHVNQPLDEDMSGCLVVRSMTTIDTYCKSGNTVTLNGAVILDRISAFDVNVTNSSYTVSITITSIADSMGQVNTLSAIFNARKGR